MRVHFCPIKDLDISGKLGAQLTDGHALANAWLRGLDIELALTLGSVVTPPEMVEPVAAVLHEAVSVYVDRVPLLKIDWVKNAATWAEK